MCALRIQASLLAIFKLLSGFLAFRNANTKCRELSFGIKMQAGRVIPDVSGYRQKFIASTYGGIVYQSFAFASITGMDGASEAA